MAKEEHYYTRFEEGRFYHIYNRTIDKKPMFFNDGNKEFFLQKLRLYLSDVADVYAYCLLDNHFHLLIRVNENLSKYRFINKIDDATDVHSIVSKQFRVFFQSYALAFNKQQNRSGTLFQTPFKRALVNDDNYLAHLIYYIHCNPQKHNLINDFKDWKWSSYKGIISNKPTRLMKTEVIKWFGNEQEYLNFHNVGKHLLNYNFIIDDF
ncbi:transposase [Pedobacter boryungensis]|uniref:Transposase n=1 Tax=Pedobacter boryungensis TaxID=869962 RepID=A0ABX2DCT6_9SPHI|nr:transposase [Pedobacter boryungensis]NQX31903.1 transposase [Pedobacter boryungensis]